MLMTVDIAVALFAIILLSLIILFREQIEHFSLYYVGSRTDCPTRNQSYDIRGDPAMIPKGEWPIQNSELGPISDKGCYFNPYTKIEEIGGKGT